MAPFGDLGLDIERKHRDRRTGLRECESMGDLAIQGFQAVAHRSLLFQRQEFPPNHLNPPANGEQRMNHGDSLVEKLPADPPVFVIGRFVPGEGLSETLNAVELPFRLRLADPKVRQAVPGNRPPLRRVVGLWWGAIGHTETEFEERDSPGSVNDSIGWSNARQTGGCRVIVHE